MGVVRVTVSDLYTDAMHEEAEGAILLELPQGCVRVYYLRIPEMEDCDGDAYFVHGQPVYFPFATWDPMVEEIWIVPHIECVKRGAS